MKRKKEKCHPRRIPNRNNQKTKIKREIEGCNREFKEKIEKISIRPIDLQFFFLFSYFLIFSLIIGIYWMAITIVFIVLSQIMN